MTVQNYSALYQDRIKIFNAFTKAIKIIWESCPWLVVVNTGLTVLQGVVPLGVLYTMKLLVDLFSAQHGSLLQHGGEYRVLTLLLFTGLFMLLEQVCRSLSVVVSTRVSDRVLDKVTAMLHEHSISIDLSFYEQAVFFDTLHRAQQEAPFRPVSIINGVFTLLQALVTLTALAGLIVSVHWSIAVVLLVAMLPAFGVKMLFANKNYDLQQKQTQDKRHLYYLNALITSDSFAKEVRLFGLGSHFIERYRKLRAVQRDENLELIDRENWYGFLGQVIALLSLLLSLGFLFFRSLAGMLTVGSLVMIYQAMQRAQSSTRSVLDAVASLYRDCLFFSNFDDFMHYSARIVSAPEPIAFPEHLLRGITFKNVSFRYPDTNSDVLSDFSLHINPGEHVALVGENGSGKSTLVKLLCRLYEPDSGQILIDGIDYRKFSLEELRKQISVVFQDYVRYYMSGRDNIRMGNIEISPDDERIEQAARWSGAHDVLNGLMGGYDSILGKLFDGGRELSIGEWQKVAIARAFLRDAPIMILDEPSSSLDVESESELFSQFNELTKGKAAVIISHRLSTVRMADRVVILSCGKIAEEGSHEELIYADGMYARLYQMQSGLYQ